MDFALEISKLKTAEQSDKLKLYGSLFKCIYDLRKIDSGKEMEQKDVSLLLSEISNDLSNENQAFVESILEQLKFLLESNETLKPFCSDEQKSYIIKCITSIIKISSDDKVLLLCFGYLDSLLTINKLDDTSVGDLLTRLSDLTCKKSVSVPVYLALCNYIQKFFNEYKDSLPSLMHIIPKLLFPPLSHSSAKIREVADKTLDNFPKLLLYAENEAVSNILIKLVKDVYCKELLLLFKEKQEAYVLKVWKHIVMTLGKNLHCNLPAMTPLFQIIEKGFKSTSDDVCKLAFLSWKSLISNFALDEAVLNDSKKLRFVLKPFKNISKFNETISLAVCDTWWHLAWCLSHNLSSRFTEVCIPLLEFTIGKVSSGSIEKAIPKTTQLFLAKRGCHFLLRLLEQPPNAAFSRISSPKKLPSLLYPALQVPLESKVIIRHSKEIISMVRTVIETFGNNKEMTSHLDSLFKSVLFIVSTVIEDRNKDSIEAAISLISLVSDITESRMCPPLTCLKCIDSLSKLPRTILVSHCFNCGSRKPQDILCTTLLKLLMNPYLFAMEIPHKKFLLAYNRLIQAGLCESLNPLLMTHKFIHIVKSAVLPENTENEILYEIWSGIASPLLESIEKTQEVNQGDKQEHDFSCLYDVLLCPFEHSFPMNMHQLRTKSAFRLWTNLYKAFIRSSSLVTTVQPNEACEQFCIRLKNYFKVDLLKEPQYFETLCFLLEVIIDSVDFTSVGASNSQGFTHGSLLLKRKKPLGNVSCLLDLLTLLLNSFYSSYLDVDEDIYQSCTPKAQRKGQICRTGVPFDLVKTFLSNIKTGSIIPSVLKELALPFSKFFSINPKKKDNTMGTKLEDLWNVVTSSIEMHYLGPYDTDFLNIMNPLLEVCISHPRRLIKERSRRFWFATFAPSVASLKIPETLKAILKKSKLSLAPEETISSLEEFSFTPDSESLENGVINFESAITFKEPFSKPFAAVASKETKVTESKSMKSNIASTNKSVDELPIDKFVKIDSPGPSSLTPKRRSIRHRKSFVPALYNDLSQSQDTQTLGGSSESFDTSSSCEIIEFKSQEVSDSKKETYPENLINLEEKEDAAIINATNSCELQKDDSNLQIIADHNKGDELSKVSLENEQEIIGKVVENIPHSAIEVNLSQDIVTKPDIVIPLINVESDVKDSIEEIVKKVSPDDSDVVPSLVESKRLNRNLKKRNANDSIITRNVKKTKNILNVSTELIKIVNTENNVNSSPDSIEVLEIPISKCDTTGNGLDNHSGKQDLVEKIVQSHAKTSLKVSSVQKVPNKNDFESFTFECSKKNSKISVCEPNQTILGVVDLSDSEEIIPSSQSSGDSVSSKGAQTTKTVKKKSSGPRKSLKFENFENESSTSESFISITILNPNGVSPMDVEETDKGECPETPVDLMGALRKEVSNQECPSVTKDSEPMPLKSSENLLSCEDLSNKLDNNEVKSVLSTVLSNDKNKLNVAENTPPFCDEVCVLQSTEHVSLKSNSDLFEQDKMQVSILNGSETQLPKTDLKLVSSNGKEESPKTMRVKSLRSAGKGSTRMSLDCSAKKKVVKKMPKRKSMSCVNESKKLKCNPFDVVDEGGERNSDAMFNLDDLSSSQESVPASIENMDLDKVTQDKSIPLSDPSQTVEFEKEENSFMMEITNVISDIQEKIESYQDSCLVDFGADEKVSELSSNEDKLTFALSAEHEDNCKESGHAEKMDTSSLCCESSGISSKGFETSQPTENDAEELKNHITENNDLKPGKVLTRVNEQLSNVEQHSQKETVNAFSTLGVIECSKPSDMENPTCFNNSCSTSPQNSVENQVVELNVIEIKNNCLPKECNLKKRVLETDFIEQKVDEDKNLSLTFSVKSESCTAINKTPQNVVNSDFPKQQINVNENSTNFQLLNSEKMYDTINFSNVIFKEETGNETCSPMKYIEKNEDILQKQEFIKDKNTIDIFGSQENILVYSNESSDVKFEDDGIHKQEACIDGIAAYEEVDENSKAYREESTGSNQLEESEEQIKQDAESLALTTIKLKKNEVELSENDALHIKNDLDVEEMNVVEISSSAPKNKGETIEECAYGKEDNLLLLVTSESDLNANSVEISDLSGNPCVSITEDAEEDTQNICNGDTLHDEEIVLDTPNLLTSETLENGSDDSDYMEVVAGSNAGHNSITQTRLHDYSKKDSTDKKTENPSRKRKGKQPVRSPFLFRQRSSIIVAKNISMIFEPNSTEVTHNKSSKRTIQSLHKKSSENVVKKQKTVPKTINTELSNKSEDTGLSSVNPTSSKSTVSSHDVKKAIETVKSLKIVNYDELTNVNTRFNASMTFRTRRYEMLAASQKADLAEESEENSYPEEEIPYLKSPNGILKKRKAASDMNSSKHRNVTFADPLVEERLFKSDDTFGKNITKQDFLVITKELQNKNSIEDVENISKASSTLPLAADEVPSSNEYQNSDNLTDYSSLPVSPLLINCEESVSSILKELTSPAWVRGLETLLLSKNIKTIGDLCKLNVHELKALPFKSPKVVCLHKALAAHLSRTQELTLEKLKAVDDWCSNLVSYKKTSEKEANSCQNEEGENDNLEPAVVQSLAEELLSNDRIKKLPKETLVLLAKKCFDEVTGRFEKS